MAKLTADTIAFLRECVEAKDRDSYESYTDGDYSEDEYQAVQFSIRAANAALDALEKATG